MGFAKQTGKSIIAERYDHAPLEKLLQDTFKDAKLADAKTDFLVTSCSVGGTPYAFTKGYRDETVKLWELGRATSAAPTYFKPFKMNSECGESINLVDGGMWVNNPSVLVAG